MPTSEKLFNVPKTCSCPQPGQNTTDESEIVERKNLSLWRERLKDIGAMTLAAYSLLWKPLLCVLAGTLIAYWIITQLYLS